MRAALALLDELGADGVSIRGIADRLGVRMNTVLWHAKTKARLLELMADAIVADVSLDGLPDHWRDRARELAHRYRRALLAHRDGARVVAGTYAAEPATLGLAEALVDALSRGGCPDREAVWTCWSIVYFVLGLVQEEQAAPHAAGDRFAALVAEGDYPALRRVLPHLRDTSFDERFEFGLGMVLDGCV
ncbi:TetR family transcriptional regulator [Saccharothrix australiensis]|uniref:TetR family transcriptional regulator n=1 Tax=Saccharothrix australiensis TaxID=2072 RepID=A0A495VWT6_9PSEU|nr:TetR family transcriptional regulator [Saccharothrix australiensis]